MKVINIMNFVRQIDERMEDSLNVLYNTTKSELEMVNEYDLEATFLLQYDALCDERYIELFKETNPQKIELGLWYEIVEPLAKACDIPYESKEGWKWDWHIKPGFSMSYSPNNRIKLIVEAMRKFKEVFGYFPKTVGSWLIDTHTINYLTTHYEINAIAICRDQTNIDAYTLVGGYFNQAYYPSKNNMFTPAQNPENQINVPVFRLLGPCPIHNYDTLKYLSNENKDFANGCFTMEAVWPLGSNSDSVDWFYKTYFENESLGFSYMQIGQENSFGYRNFLPTLRMQIEKAIKLQNVKILKMGTTGSIFKKLYRFKTPATSLVALDNWDRFSDIQSVYYNCSNYTANLFRFENSLFIRSLYLFNENVKEKYLDKKCITFDAVYENLPVVDTLFSSKNERKDCGLQISTDIKEFNVKKLDEGVLRVHWDNGEVTFFESYIRIKSKEIKFYLSSEIYKLSLNGHTMHFEYNGFKYSVEVLGAVLTLDNNLIIIRPILDDCIIGFVK